MTVTISIEGARGCGYRSAGKSGVGIYLVGLAEGEPCERLPFPLEACPCCGGGIKPSRGFTWIEPMALFDVGVEPRCDTLFQGHRHAACPMCNPWVAAKHDYRAGLIWIGEKHYQYPRDFISEAAELGISRKLGVIPRGFELGTHWIYLAHKKAGQELVLTDSGAQDVKYTPGAFFVWKPQKMELVIDDPDDIPQRALDIQEQFGEDRVELIKVIRDVDTQGVIFSDDEEE